MPIIIHRRCVVTPLANNMSSIRVWNCWNCQRRQTKAENSEYYPQSYIALQPASMFSFLPVLLVKWSASRTMSYCHWPPHGSWHNGIPDLRGPLGTTGVITTMLLSKEKDKTQAHSHIMVNWIYFLLENNSSNLQVQTAE